MTFVRIWRFAVAGADRRRFEKAYGAKGEWARLFARQDGYLGTELLAESAASADGVSAYVTLDRWRDQADWLRFLEEHGETYRALDLECETMTVEETEIGDFVTA